MTSDNDKLWMFLLNIIKTMKLIILVDFGLLNRSY